MRPLLASVAVLLLAGCGNSGDTGQTTSSGSPTPSACQNRDRTHLMSMTSPPAQTIDRGKSYTATLRTARGDFKITLDPNAAPVTVNNFVFLAQQRFYDCLTFHRRVEGFVLQGGDPSGDGTGGPAYKLPNEANPAPWKTGSVGMASSPAGINGSQFFVLLGDAPHLAGGAYNHFGVVSQGMEVAQQIQIGDQILGIDITVQ